MSQSRCFCACHVVAGTKDYPLIEDPVSAATACSRCRAFHINPFAKKPEPREPWRLQSDGDGDE